MANSAIIIDTWKCVNYTSCVKSLLCYHNSGKWRDKMAGSVVWGGYFPFSIMAYNSILFLQKKSILYENVLRSW